MLGIEETSEAALVRLAVAFRTRDPTALPPPGSRGIRVCCRRCQLARCRLWRFFQATVRYSLALECRTVGPPHRRSVSPSVIAERRSQSRIVPVLPDDTFTQHHEERCQTWPNAQSHRFRPHQRRCTVTKPKSGKSNVGISTLNAEERRRRKGERGGEGGHGTARGSAALAQTYHRLARHTTLAWQIRPACSRPSLPTQL